jgi:hypothetical protein
VPGFKKEIKQDGRPGDIERRCEDRRSLRGQWMFKSVSEKVGTQAQEKHRQEADQTSEGSRQTSANDQGIDDVVGGGADKSFCAHGSPLLPNRITVICG